MLIHWKHQHKLLTHLPFNSKTLKLNCMIKHYIRQHHKMHLLPWKDL